VTSEFRPNDAMVGPLMRDRMNQAVRTHLQDPERLGAMLDLLSVPPRALVIDANRLRGEIKRLAQSGRDTALVTLAKTLFLRLFAARHVLDEVDEHLEDWARETRVSTDSYRAAWLVVLRPLIAEVSFSGNLLTTDELARIDLLAQPPPAGDPDDGPTAIAAMVLAAPLISADRKPLVAVYGPDVDLERHDAYLDSLFGAGRVLVLSQWGQSAVLLCRALYMLGAVGIRTLTELTGALPLGVGAAAAVGWAATSGRSKEWARRASGPFTAAGTTLIEVYAYYLEAQADFNRLAPPHAPDLDTLPPTAAAARERARQSAFKLPI
jgi:predicted nucleic acid-binding protein